MIGVGIVAQRLLSRTRSAERLAFCALTVAGLVSAAVFSIPAGNDDARPDRAAAACTEARYTAPGPRAGTAGHPKQVFYSTREPVPRDQLDHVDGDGYLIVDYHSRLSANDQRRLAAWAQTADFVVVAPGERMTAPLRARTSRLQLTCRRADVASLTEFRDRWLHRMGA